MDEKTKIAIIGGTKGLGKTIAMFLVKDGFDITITGRNQELGKKTSEELKVKYSNDNKKTASLNNIIIVAVPIANVLEVVEEIKSYIKKGSLVLDVTSVKKEPSYGMEKILSEDVEIIPTHPVFGPRINSLEGQTIVLTPLKKGKWYLKIISYLKNKNMKIVESSPEEHDEMMSVVQILTHFSYISTASAIEKLGINMKESREFASPIYNLMVDMISRITSQNPFLTYSIQIENEKGEHVRETYATAVEELKNVLKSRNQDEFIEIAKSATKNLDDIQSALGRSDKAIDSLTYELCTLKKAIGNEISLENIYTKKTYAGILEDVDSDFIYLAIENQVKKIKIAEIKILNNS